MALGGVDGRLHLDLCRRAQHRTAGDVLPAPHRRVRQPRGHVAKQAEKSVVGCLLSWRAHQKKSNSFLEGSFLEGSPFVGVFLLVSLLKQLQRATMIGSLPKGSQEVGTELGKIYGNPPGRVHRTGALSPKVSYKDQPYLRRDSPQKNEAHCEF